MTQLPEAKLQSHDAEFSDHGRTKLLPVNENCAYCRQSIKLTDSWGRDENEMRVHYTSCMPKTFTPEQLDAEWRRLADADDPAIAPLEEDFQRAALEFESKLTALRELAGQSLAKGDAKKESGN